MRFTYDITVATLAGDILSAFTTGCVLLCFAFYRKDQRSFRHALVFNLTLSDFVNAACNSVSGSIFLRDHKLSAGPACTFNGWLNQISVQATDFSILAIGVCTLLVVTGRSSHVTDASRARKTAICLGVWVVPLITSTVATAMGAMGPIGGNWCWIVQERTDLRYGLTHGWRFAIFLATLAIYWCVWWQVSRHFKFISRMMPSDSGLTTQTPQPSLAPVHELEEPMSPYPLLASDPETGLARKPLRKHSGGSSRLELLVREESALSPTESAHELCTRPGTARPQSSPQGHGLKTSASDLASIRRQQTHQNEKEIKRMLLLNGYPIMYVILWIPGTISRVLEATGNTSNSELLAGLQCTTQYVGFANAVTYYFNRQVRQRVIKDLFGSIPRKRDSEAGLGG